MPDSSGAKPVAPPSNLTSLRARLRNHARDVSQVETRVQRRLAALVVNEIFLAADLGISEAELVAEYLAAVGAIQ